MNRIFALIKNVEPSLETRIQLRTTVATELARLRLKDKALVSVWWKRSIRVPLPVAIGACVLAVFALLNDPRLPRRPIDGIAASRTQPERKTHIEPADDSRKRIEKTHTLKRYVSATYLCGVGPLSTETRYVFQESDK